MKRSLAALALLGLVAMPAGAQDVHMWDDARPDAITPLGVRAAEMLPVSGFHFGYEYRSATFEGIQVGSDLVELSTILNSYAQAPFELKESGHRLSLGFGFSEEVSMIVSGEWIDRTRGQIDGDDFFNFYETTGISDLTADLMVGVYSGDAIRSVLNLGVDIPTGAIDETGTDLTGSTVVLPFDQQIGAGSVAIRPGMSARVQNEKALLGAQVEARVYLSDADRGYRYGNTVDARLWAGYTVSDLVAVTSGVYYNRFGDMDGADTGLDRLADPGQDPIFTAGTRVDIPLGVTLVMPDDGLFAGAALQAEWLFPVFQDYDRPRLRGDSAFRIGIRKSFQSN